MARKVVSRQKIAFARHKNWHDIQFTRHFFLLVPKSVFHAELNNITEAVGAHAGGVGVDALLTALGDSIPRRTLQRRLAQLADAHVIRAIGVGRATRYQRALQIPPANFAAEPVGDYQTTAPSIPMSPEGAEIRAPMFAFHANSGATWAT